MLSALWLGDDRMLRPGCEALTARHREQPATLRGALFAIGLLALMIGWRLRDPVSLWLAALAGVWTLQHLMLHMAAFLPIGELNLRMSPQSFLVGQMLLRFGFMLPLTVFCLRYLGLRLPRIERCIWAVAGAAALLASSQTLFLDEVLRACCCLWRDTPGATAACRATSCCCRCCSCWPATWSIC